MMVPVEDNEARLAKAAEVSRRRREVVEHDEESGLDIYTAPLRIGHLEEPGGGWLSPEGRFYRCPDVCHLELARRLCLDFGWIKVRTRRRLNQADVRLDRAGWARIWDNGLVFKATFDLPQLTQAQLDAIFDLAVRHREMEENLMYVLYRRREMEEADG